MSAARPELRPVIRRDDRLALKIVISLLVIYVVLSIIVILAGTQNSTDLDRDVTLWLQRGHTPAMDAFMEFISWWASVVGVLPVIGALGLLFALRRRYLEVGFLFAPLLCIPIVSIIKRLVNRARPTADAVRVIRDFNHESFPSGHVVFYVVFFGFILYLMYRHWTLPNIIRWPVGALCVLLIVTVPFSRMYLGAHWFTDVSAGFALGSVLLIGLVAWYNRSSRARARVHGGQARGRVKGTD